MGWGWGWGLGATDSRPGNKSSPQGQDGTLTVAGAMGGLQLGLAFHYFIFESGLNLNLSCQ